MSTQCIFQSEKCAMNISGVAMCQKVWGGGGGGGGGGGHTDT